jgi:hypothetical protein
MTNSARSSEKLWSAYTTGILNIHTAANGGRPPLSLGSIRALQRLRQWLFKHALGDSRSACSEGRRQHSVARIDRPVPETRLPTHYPLAENYTSRVNHELPELGKFLELSV